MSQKENDNFLATKTKNVEYCDITDKGFKIAVMKKFSELQENSERPYNDLRNKINKIIYQRH